MFRDKFLSDNYCWGTGGVRWVMQTSVEEESWETTGVGGGGGGPTNHPDKNQLEFKYRDDGQGSRPGGVYNQR